MDIMVRRDSSLLGANHLSHRPKRAAEDRHISTILVGVGQGSGMKGSMDGKDFNFRQWLTFTYFCREDRVWHPWPSLPEHCGKPLS